MILGLFGYYPWHYGVLDLGIETLAYVGDLVTSTIILSGALGVYPQDIGLFVCFVCRLLGLHALSMIGNSSVYNRYSAQFL